MSTASSACQQIAHNSHVSMVHSKGCALPGTDKSASRLSTAAFFSIIIAITASSLAYATTGNDRIVSVDVQCHQIMTELSDEGCQPQQLLANPPPEQIPRHDACQRREVLGNEIAGTPTAQLGHTPARPRLSADPARMDPNVSTATTISSNEW
eukprot:SAG31_NODE_15758_length_740_cov_0.954758_2_plen_153_part_00